MINKRSLCTGIFKLKFISEAEKTKKSVPAYLFGIDKWYKWYLAINDMLREIKSKERQKLTFSNLGRNNVWMLDKNQDRFIAT